MFVLKQKTAYEVCISDWSSDVCSSDLMNLTISHFDDQDAIVSEVIRGLGEHTPHRIQSVFTACQAKSRLVMKLSRHVVEIFGIDIWRIGNDQIKTLIWQPVETIALHGINPLFESVMLDVLVGDLDRIERQVSEHHRSEEHTSELQSLIRISYSDLCLKLKQR